MSTRRHHGFTLVEMIIVVTIVVLLVSLMLPSLGRARSHGKMAQCASNLHQFGLASGAFQSQKVLTVGAPTALDMMSLKAYLSNPGVYLCPEDIPLAGDLTARIATYSSSNHTGGPLAPAGTNSFMFDMDISPNIYCWKSTISSTHYLLNFEDQQAGQAGGDLSFYNFYLDVTLDSSGNTVLKSLATAPTGDTKPPTCKQTGGPGTGIGGSYSFDLVDSKDNVLRTPFPRGDPNPYVLASNVTSYGMNTLYPAQMARPGIIILDFLTPAAQLAGPGYDSSAWPAGLSPPVDSPRPPFNRHMKRFNALFADFSVRTLINPNDVDPISPANQKQWWGGP